MNKNLKLSVIIPVYNASEFIKDAYNFIVNQGIHEIEILFVDNNSTDSSVSIINNIIEGDNRVQLLFEKKQGAAAARNKGVKYARGEYIYFFDVDDMLFNNALKSLIKILESRPDIDVVFGKCFRSGIRKIDKKKQEECSQILEIKDAPYFGIYWFSQFASLEGTPSFLHRRRVLKKHDIKFNEQLKLGEDAYFHILIGLNCRVASLDQFIFTYYRHEKSTVSTQNKISSKVETYWEQHIKGYIPYCLNNDVPKEFEILLQKKLFRMLPKIVSQKRGIVNRFKTYRKLTKEMLPIKQPIALKSFTYLIILTGSNFLYIVYMYFVNRYYFKWF